ncbi:DUF222 domain-containing protein [Tersicoccus sp. MR15.9]|uniref:HNH endonuclease signature motif containing protein n=1 Tax=Tersicoccus mangrovi TaxID=3121635 RepID=UPI002FE67683
MEDTSTRGRMVPATLPGLDDGAPSVSRTRRVPGDSAAFISSDAVAPTALLGRLSTVLAEHDTARTTLDSAVSALEDVRRLEGWLAAARHRATLLAQRVAEENHRRWVEAHPSVLEDPASEGGLTRRERLAVGDRSGVAEIACALRISEDAAHAQLRCAERLTLLLPATLAALQTGRISARAAETIADETAEYADALPDCSDPEMQERLARAIDVTETALLQAARNGQTVRQMRSRARRVRERCHPRTFAQRHAAALADRYVRVTPDGDGMARLTALLPAVLAWKIDVRLSALARQLATQQDDVVVSLSPAVGVTSAAGPTPGEDDRTGATHDGDDDRRTVAQLRTDVLADLLGGPTEGDAGRRTGTDWQVEAAPTPRVLLTVSAAALLGGDEPGWLGSFGPIPATDARDLVRRATSCMLGVIAGPGGLSVSPSDDTGGPPAAEGTRPDDLDDPPPDGIEPACVIPVMLTTGLQYRVPTALRRALTVRDGTCRFPGCRRSAVACDVDHVTAWTGGGTTVPENLAHLCRKHHVLKHHSGWSVESAADHAFATSARLRWTSPAGRIYLTDPEPPPF